MLWGGEQPRGEIPRRFWRPDSVNYGEPGARRMPVWWTQIPRLSRYDRTTADKWPIYSTGILEDVLRFSISQTYIEFRPCAMSSSDNTSSRKGWLAEPSGPCCLKGTLHKGTPRGQFVIVAGVETYLSRPRESQSNGHILLYFPDVWGMFPNGLLVMDAFADAGYLVLGLDYFRGVFPPVSTSSSCGWLVLDLTWWPTGPRLETPP
jgi:hypothetical protein